VAELRAELAAFLVHRASIALTHAADARSSELHAMVDPATRSADRAREAASTFAECQFGYLAALHEWAGNTAARSGLDVALSDMARIDLAHGSLEQAARWLAQRSTPDLALAGSLAEAETRRDAEREAARRQRSELDLGRFAQQRRYAFAAITSIAIVISVLAILDARRGATPTQLTIVQYWIVVVVGTAAATWLLRRSVLATEMNRRIMGLMWALLCGEGINRLVGWHRGTPVEDLFIFEMIASTMTVVIGALVVTRKALWLLPLTFGGLAASLAFPAWILEIFGALTVVGMGFLVLILGTEPES